MESKTNILKLYEERKYDLTTDLLTMMFEQENHLAIKKYLNEEISFDELMDEVGGGCPINACHWCDRCEACDIKKYETEERCRICWERCLGVV